MTFHTHGGSALSPVAAQFAGTKQGVAGALPPGQKYAELQVVQVEPAQKAPGAQGEQAANTEGMRRTKEISMKEERVEGRVSKRKVEKKRRCKNQKKRCLGGGLERVPLGCLFYLLFIAFVGDPLQVNKKLSSIILGKKKTSILGCTKWKV